MLIFTGYGWTVPAISFGCCLACEYVVERATGDDLFYQRELWPLPAALCASAVILTAIDLAIRRRDLQNGAVPAWFRIQDSFFFLPLNVWPPILLICAAGSVAGLW
ncbi:hypothetical protein [Alienimonas chondri]|uniref:Uncharacterized protein n=1 Tax=Alienimonas chondri TaxID=2681879 RepID=A0ABX1VC47_9PLAN|nr:hypothetical protein [Alienimonas chondri]NNJ25011.1 hypothetical protein [Alienimonas chondri]